MYPSLSAVLLHVRAMILHSTPSMATIYFNQPSLSFLIFLQPSIQVASPLVMFSVARTSQVADNGKDQAHRFFAVAVTTYVLAVIAVSLRFWARRLMKAQTWVDDWIVALALV